MIDLPLALDSKATVRCNVSFDVLRAPTMYDTVLPARCEEHAVVVCDGDAIHRILMLVERCDQATLWSEFLCCTSLLTESILACELTVGSINRY